MFYNFKKTFLFLVTAIIAISFSSCKDSETDPVSTVKYNLIINNHTANGYDIYMKQDINTSDFTKVGFVAANSSYTYQNLVVSVNYTFRLVQGMDVNVFAYEKVVTSNNSSNYIWDIN